MDKKTTPEGKKGISTYALSRVLEIFDSQTSERKLVAGAAPVRRKIDKN